MPVLYRVRENLRFSSSRKILLHSLFLWDVTLENRLYRYFCVAAMIMMLIYASKCVTLVCNHTNIAWIWNWYRVVTDGDNCLFLVEARPEVCMKGVAKGFLRYKMSRHFKNIGTCQFMFQWRRWKRASASREWCLPWSYNKKVWWRWFFRDPYFIHRKRLL